MYPQYSSTTTGSSLNEWNRLFQDDIPIHYVETFYRNTIYLDAVVEKVNEALARFSNPTKAEILFSAHSIPISVVEKGDPYQRQVEETAAAIAQHLDGVDWSVCYQSRVGPLKWIGPSTDAEVTRAGNDDSLSTMLLRVEAALREAKRYGHNRTFTHEGKYPTPVVPPELKIEPLHIQV